MPRSRKPPEQRQQARQEAVRRYNVSDKGKAARRRWRARQQDKRVQAVVEQQRVQVERQEIRDDSGKLIAYRLSDGTIQAL